MLERLTEDDLAPAAVQRHSARRTRALLAGVRNPRVAAGADDPRALEAGRFVPSFMSASDPMGLQPHLQ